VCHSESNSNKYQALYPTALKDEFPREAILLIFANKQVRMIIPKVSSQSVHTSISGSNICLLTKRLLSLYLTMQDLPGAMSAAEMTEKLGLHTLPSRTWYIQSTVATAGDGIYEGFDWWDVSVL
jgi:hypothetical protein